MHIVSLVHQALEGATHGDHVVVGVGAEDDYTLGIGFCPFGTVGVVGIWFPAWPSGDGVL